MKETNDPMKKHHENAELLKAFRKLDEVEQTIFIAGLRQVADDQISVEQFGARFKDLLERHRTGGEDLTISDLENWKEEAA